MSFQKMLVHQSKISNREEYPDKLINELTDQFEIFGSIAECASSFEHNLLASAFFEVFSYTGKLNNLFNVLLNTEVALSVEVHGFVQKKFNFDKVFIILRSN